MNFVIECIKRNPTSDKLVFVVRYGNGAPIQVCDTLDSAKLCIEEQVKKALSVTEKSA